MARTKQTARRGYLSSKAWLATCVLEPLPSSLEPSILKRKIRQSRYFEHVVNRRCLNCDTAEVYATVRLYKNHTRTKEHLLRKGTDPNKHEDNPLDERQILRETADRLNAKLALINVLLSKIAGPDANLAKDLLNLPCHVFPNCLTQSCEESFYNRFRPFILISYFLYLNNCFHF